MSTILFIDGRNFIGKLNAVLNPNNDTDKRVDYTGYDFDGLLQKVLAGISVDRRIFYFGKLVRHQDTAAKSDELIGQQRHLKAHLEKLGFEVVIAGRVRGHVERCTRGHETLTFKEKGVDVRMAVDMITLACRRQLHTAIIASSDSDFQPAITGLRNLGVERIYLGFENAPNKGLTFTTNRTLLIRNSEIADYLEQQATLDLADAA